MLRKLSFLLIAICGIQLSCAAIPTKTPPGKHSDTFKTNGPTLFTGAATTRAKQHSHTNQQNAKTTFSASIPATRLTNTPVTTSGNVTGGNKTNNVVDPGKTDLTSGIANLLGGHNMASLQHGFSGLSAKQIAELLNHNSALQYHKDNAVTSDLQQLQGFVKLLGNDTDISISDLQMLQKVMKNKEIMGLLPKLLGIISSDTFTNLLPKIKPLLDSLGNVSELLARVLPLIGDLLQKKLHSISDPYGISPNCTNSMGDFIQGLIDGKEASLEMLDAAGKPTTSLLKGNVAWIGNYDECQVYGSYCALSVEPPAMFKDRLNVKVPTGKIDLRLDVCIPHACNATELQRLAQHVFHLVSMQLSGVKCLESRGLLKEDDNAIIALCVCGVILVLTGCGVFVDLLKKTSKEKEESYQLGPIDAYANVTYNINGSGRIGKKVYPGIPLNEITSSGKTNDGYDGGEIIKSNGPVTRDTDAIEGLPDSLDIGDSGYSNVDTESEEEELRLCDRLVFSFSLKRNLSRILDTKPRDDMLSCLDGIRVLSMCYLMLAFIFTTYTPDQLANGLNMLESKRKFLLQAIINGTLSTDTFFLLSGTVVSYLFLKETKRRGGIKITQMVYYYLHRIWRLTPLYGLILMTYYCLSKYLVTGPFQDNNSQDRANCKENWWVNLLYINNIYRTDKICMVWSTFLADVMQFHIIAPIVLIPFVYLKWIGILIALPFILAHIISTGVQEHRLSGSIVDPGIFGGDTDTWFYQIYIKPWTRVGPYAIGLILGYILIKHKKKTLNITGVIAGWVFAIALMLLTTFVTYSNYNTGTPTWNLLDYTVFQAFFRIGWSTGVAWVIFACATGHGDAINSFLSWKAWKPLSKLTFAAYLIHPLVQAHHMYNMRVKVYYNEITVFFNFMAMASTTYLISLAVAVILEAPFRSLERAVIRKRKNQ